MSSTSSTCNTIRWLSLWLHLCHAFRNNLLPFHLARIVHLQVLWDINLHRATFTTVPTGRTWNNHLPMKFFTGFHQDFFIFIVFNIVRCLFFNVFASILLFYLISIKRFSYLSNSSFTLLIVIAFQQEFFYYLLLPFHPLNESPNPPYLQSLHYV